MCSIFIDDETGPVSREFQKNSALVRENKRIRSKAIDPQTDCDCGCVTETGTSLKNEFSGFS
jgi:hypothetical protein